MLRKTLCVFAFVCVIQEINARPQQNPTKASPLQEAIQRINPELDKITLRLKELKLEIHKSLLRDLAETHGLISQFGGKILEALNQLQSNNTEISKIANRSDTNIEPCVFNQRTKLERVLMVANSKIKQTSEDVQLQANNLTEKSNELVKEADDIDKNINKIIGYCIRQNNLAWQQEKLIECLFNEASYVNKKVDQLFNQKDLLDAETERNTLTNNVTTNQDNLLKWISTLKEDFFKCVSESEINLNVPKKPQEATFLGNENTEILRKPDTVEILHQSFTETNKTVPVNLDQQLKTIDNEQRIFERIRRIEFLLDRLKQLHQFEDLENVDKTLIFKKDGLDLNHAVVSSNPVKVEKNEAIQPPPQNRKYILYISF